MFVHFGKEKRFFLRSNCSRRIHRWSSMGKAATVTLTVSGLRSLGERRTSFRLLSTATKKLDSIDFPRVKQWLDDHLPRSVFLSQWLRLNIDRPDGVGTSEKSVCHVDRWPNPRIVAGIDFTKFYGSDAFPKMCLFAKDDEDSERIEAFLLELSEELGIARIGGCEIKAIASRSRPICDKVATTLGISSSINVCPCRGYWLAPRERVELARRTIHPPIGFRFDTLDPIESELVDSTWPHRIEGVTLSLIERHIRHFPNACLRSTTTIGDERLACFELTETELGIMSHLYTMCEFRRRGLATLVEMKLAQSLVRNDQIPVKPVLVENESGEAFARSNGLWSYFGDIVWIRYGNEEMGRRFADVDGGGGVR